MEFIQLKKTDKEGIQNMSRMAAAIVREHFDPIIGKAQNDYMLSMFQTPQAIQDQLLHGYQYYFIKKDSHDIGFLAFYPGNTAMYLSKFYLYKEYRKHGCAHTMMDFVIQKTREAQLSSIELNCNKYNDAIPVYEALGFQIIRSEKNDIGNGFFMDDYVLALKV